MELRKIWENARLTAGDSKSGIVESGLENIGDYELKDNHLIIDIGKGYYDQNEEEIELVEIESIIRESFSDIGLDSKTEIKFNLLN